MLTGRGVIVVVLLSAPLLSACGDGSPSAPTPTISPTPSTGTSPTPTPAANPSPVIGVWKVALRLTQVEGIGCVADTMRSQIGQARPYSLSMTENHIVTLRSASGDRACSFSPTVDGSDFTTDAQGGYYRCEPWYLEFRCNDGSMHRIFTIGENVSGRASGNEISGTWRAHWFDGWDDYSGIPVTAQFTGSRE